MRDREMKETEEIYSETSDLLVLLTKLNSKWLRVRDLINQHNYIDLNRFNRHSQTLDELFSAEQQIRQMLKYYSEKITKLKQEDI